MIFENEVALDWGAEVVRDVEVVAVLEKDVEVEGVGGGIESQRFIGLAWLRLLVKEEMEDKGGTEGARKE